MSRFRLKPTRFLPAALLAGLLAFTTDLVSSALPAHAQSVRATSLASLLLSTSDIKHVYGSGFKVIISRQTKNSELRAATGSAGSAQLQGLAGRVTGYISMFSHQLITLKGNKVTTKPGVTLVLTGVNQYQNADYARRTMTTALHTKAKLPKGTTEHVAPLNGVGDSGVTLSVHTIAAGTPPTDSIYIGFQRGKYTAVLDVASYGGKPNGGTVLGLARLLDARIRSKG
jgi:hypothetical protein